MNCTYNKLMKKTLIVGMLLVAGCSFFWSPLSVEAAASLTMSAPTIGATGKTLTVTMTGISGSLSPASGVTGFTVYVTTSGKTAAIKTGTITTSGSTVTIPLSGVILSGETVAISLATSPTSNLTDGGSNTPASSGNTDIGVTNNSTKTGTIYNSANANIWKMGYFPAPFALFGHNWLQQAGNGSRIDMVINGTDADVQIFNAGGSYTVTVDGISSTITPGADATYQFMWVPVFSGLSAANHSVTIRNSSDNWDSFDSDATIRVAGTGLASEGGDYATPVIITDKATLGYIRLDGSPATSTAFSYPEALVYSNTYNHGENVIRFRAAITDISVWAWVSSAGAWQIYQDGTLVQTYYHDALARFSNYRIASGLDGTSHVYEIVETGAPDQQTIYYSMMLGGGTGLVASTLSPTTRPTVVFYGDSIVAGFGIGTSTLIDSWLSTRPLGLSDKRLGLSGSCVSLAAPASPGCLSGDRGQWLRDHTSLISGLYPRASMVITTGGVNDITAGVSVSDFQTDMGILLTNIAASVDSGTPIVVRGILPTVGVNNTTRLTFQTAQAAAVTSYMTACGGSCTKPVYFANADTWADTSDPVHPIASGYTRIASHQIPIIYGLLNGSSYTASGPSSGNVGIASTNFTVTLLGTATFTGDETITLSDSSGGGTFTPSVGSSGVSSVVVTPTNGSTSFTFTYTPASSGSKTLSFDAGQDVWTDPTSLTYTVVSAPAAPTAVAATVGNTTSSISFTPGSNGGSAITSYTVYASAGGITGTGSASPILLTGLTNGTPYTFVVTATNAIGTSTASASSTPITPATVPGAPTSISASAGNAQAIVSFTAPVSNGGSAITSYAVFASGGGITATGSASPITLTGLTNDTAYTFSVVAVNALGTSTLSASSTPVTPIVPVVVSSGGGGGGGSVAGLIGGTNVSNTPILAPSIRSTSSTVSTAALEAQIAQLMTVLNSLIAQAAQQGIVVNNINNAPTPSFSRNLQLNDIGLDVKALQVYLNTHGFLVAISGPGSSGQETTKFGRATYSALIKYQKAHGIVATGYFGSKTRDSIE